MRSTTPSERGEDEGVRDEIIGKHDDVRGAEALPRRALEIEAEPEPLGPLAAEPGLAERGLDAPSHVSAPDHVDYGAARFLPAAKASRRCGIPRIRHRPAALEDPLGHERFHELRDDTFMGRAQRRGGQRVRQRGFAVKAMENREQVSCTHAAGERNSDSDIVAQPELELLLAPTQGNGARGESGMGLWDERDRRHR